MQGQYTGTKSWQSFPIGFSCGQVDLSAYALLRITDTEACFKFCVTHFSKRNNVRVRRGEGENLLVMCKGGMEKGDDGYVPRREGATTVEVKHCMSSILIPFTLLAVLTGDVIRMLHDINA